MSKLTEATAIELINEVQRRAVNDAFYARVARLIEAGQAFELAEDYLTSARIGAIVVALIPVDLKRIAAGQTDEDGQDEELES